MHTGLWKHYSLIISTYMYRNWSVLGMHYCPAPFVSFLRQSYKKLLLQAWYLEYFRSFCGFYVQEILRYMQSSLMTIASNWISFEYWPIIETSHAWCFLRYVNKSITAHIFVTGPKHFTNMPWLIPSDKAFSSWVWNSWQDI